MKTHNVSINKGSMTSPPTAAFIAGDNFDVQPEHCNSSSHIERQGGLISLAIRRQHRPINLAQELG